MSILLGLSFTAGVAIPLLLNKYTGLDNWSIGVILVLLFWTLLTIIALLNEPDE